MDSCFRIALAAVSAVALAGCKLIGSRSEKEDKDADHEEHGHRADPRRREDQAGRRRVVAPVKETFLIPASDGKIHHIRARFYPRIQRG